MMDMLEQHFSGVSESRKEFTFYKLVYEPIKKK